MEKNHDIFSAKSSVINRSFKASQIKVRGKVFPFGPLYFSKLDLILVVHEISPLNHRELQIGSQYKALNGSQENTTHLEEGEGKFSTQNIRVECTMR